MTQFLPVVGFLVLAVLSVTAARRAIRPRSVDTALPPQVVRQIFVESVTGFGWRIVDDGDPLVAQSSLLAGPRQRITLTCRTANGRTDATAEVTWYEGRWIGMPQHPWTLQWRMRRFVRAVENEDPTAN